MSKGKKRVVIFDGVEYESVRSACRALKLQYSTVENRLARGVPLEQALDPNFKRRYGKIGTRTVVEGETYLSLNELAYDMFLEPETLKGRLKKGYTLEQAIDPDFSFKYDKRRRRDTMYGGKSLSVISTELGLSKNAVSSRLSRGYTIEQAIDPDFSTKYAKRKRR